MKILFTTMLLLFNANVLRAGTAEESEYILAVSSIYLAGADEYTFDLSLHNTGNQKFNYAICQYIIMFNTEVLNGGVPSLELVQGSSELLPLQVPPPDKLSISKNEMRIFGEHPPGVEACTVILPGASLRIGKFSIKNSKPFLGAAPAFNFKITGKLKTKVYAYIGNKIKELNLTNHNIDHIYSEEDMTDIHQITSLRLFQNYPNPFNPETTISFDIPRRLNVSLKIYNAAGELVKTLIDNRQMNANNYVFAFKAGELPGGVYFCVLNADEYRLSRKMILLK